MQPLQQTPYDFIMNPGQKKQRFGLGGGSQKTRIIQVIIGAAILIIAAVILFSVISSSNKSSTESLVNLAASQQDIIDIAKLGSTNVRDQQLLAKSASVLLLLTSQNNGTVATIKSQGNKNPTKQIASLQVKTYTKTLSDAQSTGNYDTVYLALLTNRIDEYRTRLQAAYVNAPNDTAKKQFSDYYQQLEVLYPPSTAAN